MSMQDPRPDQPHEPLTVTDALAQISFEVMSILTALAAEENLSLTLLRMLAILRDRQPRMAELARRLGTDRSSTTGLISRAESRGLVIRHPDPTDGRSFTVSLTPQGMSFATVLGDRAATRINSVLVNLHPSERDILTQLLTRALDSAEH